MDDPSCAYPGYHGIQVTRFRTRVVYTGPQGLQHSAYATSIAPQDPWVHDELFKDLTSWGHDPGWWISPIPQIHRSEVSRDLGILDPIDPWMTHLGYYPRSYGSGYSLVVCIVCNHCYTSGETTSIPTATTRCAAGPQ